ncbi:unnamed protein product [Lactuca saligna]|uniref:FAR1 domain-containing protein n=1 Tax=Lactuca saligna TaxID=75948 RepID=A0AA35UZN4_LACSI|nr:unnamed protein product [Lactuca saligna]
MFKCYVFQIVGDDSSLPIEASPSDVNIIFSDHLAECSKSNASSCESEQFRNECDSSNNDDKMFIHEVPDEMKPKEKDVYNSLKDGVEFYLQYAKEVGFDASKSTIKRSKGEISLRYVICSRSGFSECVNNDSNNEKQPKLKRKTSSRKMGSITLITFKCVAFGSLQF